MTTPHLSMALYFLKEQPEAAARQLEREPPQQVAELLQQATPSVAAATLATMMPDQASRVLTLMTDEQAARLFSELNSADIATIFRLMDEAPRSHCLTLMSPRKQAACQRLLSYPDYTVGAWIETDILMLTDTMQAKEALLRIRKSTRSDLQHSFVVNQNRQLIGPVSVYKLLHASESTPVSRLVEHHTSGLSGFTELQAAIDMSIWQQTDTLPVVNLNNELIGIIHHHRLRYVLNRQSARKQLALPYEVLNAYAASVGRLLELFSPQH
ncbi:magnesium transporter [Lacimicrobium sp. SS2-24]|uniref:magnesium transporter n=1 Tax=Lacimicrobium sp. SS2-24 TaxID=2005569 RepID=UPI00143AC4FB|nr:magnesium transporter [Lacimicrobium sp. SS2-24]